MRIGALILPEFPWSIARKVWRHAEELGFDHVWTYDHLAWRSLRDSPWFGAIPTLSAAATATERIRLGTLVATPNFRHPVPFAKELITLDDISAGRLTLGIGAGSTGWDATMLGQVEVSRRARADRFAEFVELLDRLLREPATSFKGSFYSAHEARNYPGCTQRPRIPFAIAASGVRGMRLAATYGESWVTTGDRTTQQPLGAVAGVRVVREQMAWLDEVCAKLGRDPASLRRVVVTGPNLEGGLGSLEMFCDTIGRYADEGVSDFVVHWPRRNGPYAGDLSSFERIILSSVSSQPDQPEQHSAA
jgi:alkanesulfonate monooxygenase SsuD/methylene tetrahydromethanopterin reductase-like flavin-dependent oxidoreductase (luciferase family)